METIMYKKFDLEAAKNGSPVITRDGKQARIVCFDVNSKDDQPILALITRNDGYEGYSSHCINGDFYFNENQSPNDLFMAPVKKKGWINIYPPVNNYTAALTNDVHKTRDQADRDATKARISCIEIEWTE
jgi:hypothetical protein